MTGIEIPVGKLLAPLVGQTLKSCIRALAERVKLGRAGITRDEKQTLQFLRAAEIESTINVLSYFADLPDGISLRDIERTMQSREVAGLVKELISMHLTHVPSQVRDRIRDNFVTVFSRIASPSDPLQLTDISSRMFDKMEEECGRLTERLDQVDSKLFMQLRSTGQDLSILASLESINRHLELIANQTKLPDLEAWVGRYLQQARNAHGSIVPPDLETKIKVPIDALYVSPRLSRIGDSSAPRINADDLANDLDRTVVIGDPGGGKSTVSQWIVYKTSTGAYDDAVPFLIVLRDFQSQLKNDSSLSIVKYIETRCSAFYQCEPPHDAVESLLMAGRALLVFDGLDELLDLGQRRELTEKVELFCTRYPLSAVLVTSREVGYEQAQLDPAIFTVYRLAGFTPADVHQYVERWFKFKSDASDDALKSISRSFYDESKDVPDLTRNPLTLALMCIIYRGEGSFPKSRPKIYERCASLLFEKWDSHRQIHTELQAADYLDDALKRLAYWMMFESNSEVVTAQALEDECTRFLLDDFASPRGARQAAKQFVEFCNGRAWVFSDAGSTADGEDLYKFTHRTFMEYFAAFHLTRTIYTPAELGRFLLPKVSERQFDVVAQLAIQIFDKSTTNGGEKVFRYLLDDKRKRSVDKRAAILNFVIRCMSFTNVSADFARTVVKRSIRICDDMVSSPDIPVTPVEAIDRIMIDMVEIRTQARDVLQDELTAIMEGIVGQTTLPDLIPCILTTLPNHYYRRAMYLNDSAENDSWGRWFARSFGSNGRKFLTADVDRSYYWFGAMRTGLISFDEYAVGVRSAAGPLPLDVLTLDERGSRSVSDSFGRDTNFDLLVSDMYYMAHASLKQEQSEYETRRVTEVLSWIEGVVDTTEFSTPLISMPSRGVVGIYLPMDRDLLWRCVDLTKNSWAVVLVFALMVETAVESAYWNQDEMLRQYDDAHPLYNLMLTRLGVTAMDETELWLECNGIGLNPEQSAIMLDWAGLRASLWASS